MYHLATQNIHQLDDERRPVGHASACLIRYQGIVFVLTVSHATGNQGDWAVEIDFDTAAGKTRMHRIGGMNFLKIARLKHHKLKIRDVDFSYKLLTEPIEPRFQIVAPSGAITHDEPKRIIDTDLSATPFAEETYGFWGCVGHNYDTFYLRVEPKLETEMKFDGEHEGLLFFKTKAPYKSYEEYRGCSGAPIFDSQGRLVSLVVQGDKHKTGIYGVNLRDFRAALDVEILQSQGFDSVKA